MPFPTVLRAYPNSIGGQPTALRLALMNLIHNAVTYGDEAEVRLTPGKERVEVMIGDRGPGIPSELREQVFTPFFRLEQSRNRETGGTGLGLAVAKIAIQRHGGEITLTEGAEGGLLVQVRLPISFQQWRSSGFLPDQKLPTNPPEQRQF